MSIHDKYLNGKDKLGISMDVRKDMERKIAGQRAVIRALESTILQPHRVARRVAENPEAKDPPHGAVRKG